VPTAVSRSSRYGQAVGIDLGTTNRGLRSGGGEPVVIPMRGRRTTPSCRVRQVGETRRRVAKRQAITNPDPPSGRSSAHRDRRGPSTSTARTTRPRRSRRASWASSSGMPRFLGDTVSQAVITSRLLRRRPADATKEAGPSPARVLRIINEPTAAALPTARQEGADQTVLCSTSAAAPSTSRSRIGDGVFRVKSRPQLQLAATTGQRIIDWLVKTFKDTEGVDLSTDKMPPNACRAAEKAKIELSSLQRPDQPAVITATSEGPSTSTSSCRGKFNELTSDLSTPARALRPGHRRLGPEQVDIDHVVLVGGSTRSPRPGAVQQMTARRPTRASTRQVVASVPPSRRVLKARSKTSSSST